MIKLFYFCSAQNNDKHLIGIFPTHREAFSTANRLFMDSINALRKIVEYHQEKHLEAGLVPFSSAYGFSFILFGEAIQTVSYSWWVESPAPDGAPLQQPFPPAIGQNLSIWPSATPPPDHPTG